MPTTYTRTSHLEVERKFVPNPLLHAQLDGEYGKYERLRKLQQAGQVPTAQTNALTFFRLPDKEMRDEYVDCDSQLSQKGVWMRHRTTLTLPTSSFPYVHTSEEQAGERQAKLRIAGDYTSSQMLEASGEEDMRRVLDMYVKSSPGKEIETTAELTTERKTYLVQRPFGWHSQANAEGETRIVLDSVTATTTSTTSTSSPAASSSSSGSFQHTVGEIELTAEVSGGESDQEHQRLRGVEAARMQAPLDEFVGRYAVLFAIEGVKGKLEAWFKWKAEQDRSGDVNEAVG